jgi:hypothetical protein
MAASRQVQDVDRGRQTLRQALPAKLFPPMLIFPVMTVQVERYGPGRRL